MVDPNEIEALKAAFRGAITSAESLAALREKIDGLDAHGDVSEADLAELARVTLAHAVSSAALRGLVEGMRARRGSVVDC
ncbi:MAG: hypothetical protein LC804_04945 [Acidobacteria bacterium]|nr:hypothetical protein [Acidobacteriota bacterium]